MLEVNDFNAVRISLASPEQIRSWSYGEVTKPETINYRTLKPEKDGLFCEKIFGPTKDFECYCGKYKRVRYKGIICDKCGVEVARTKVRRERMGHIELACPVSHIWFVKGTPEPPRPAARHLPAQPRARAVLRAVHHHGRRRGGAQALRSERSRRRSPAEAARPASAGRARGRAQGGHRANRTELTTALTATKAELESQRTTRTEEIVAAAQAVEAKLAELKTGAAEESIVFEPTGEVIVAAGEKGGKTANARLRAVAGGESERVNEEIQQRERDEATAVDQKIADLRAAMDETLTAEKVQLKEQAQGLKDELRKRREELESIKPMLTVGESRSSASSTRNSTGRKGRSSTRAWAPRRCATSSADGSRDARPSAAGRGPTSSGQRRKKATKRLRVVEAFRRSGNTPEWMIFTVLPVIPPGPAPDGAARRRTLRDLRPERPVSPRDQPQQPVQAAAGARRARDHHPQREAYAAGGRRRADRQRPPWPRVSGTGNHKLKSLTDMLKGKQGRFRQNLLGKRVDYSGRSVIVVGPELKLHQCGLPKRMALELFKPFVMRPLVEQGLRPQHQEREAHRRARAARKSGTCSKR